MVEHQITPEEARPGTPLCTAWRWFVSLRAVMKLGVLEIAIWCVFGGIALVATIGRSF